MAEQEVCIAEKLKGKLSEVTGLKPEEITPEIIPGGGITAIAKSADGKITAGVGVTTGDGGSTATVAVTEAGRTGSASVLQQTERTAVGATEGERIQAYQALPMATGLAAAGQAALKACRGKKPGFSL